MSDEKIKAYISYATDHDRRITEIMEVFNELPLEHFPMKLRSIICEMLMIVDMNERKIYDLKKGYETHRHLSYDELGEQATSEPIEEE